MNFQQKVQGLIRAIPPVYPGAAEELMSMTMAHGCDINEHVPTLVKYGKKVNRITELGVRFGWSTRSFLYAQPKKLHSIDKYSWGSIEQAGGNPHPPGFYHSHYQELNPNVDFTLQLADTTKIDPIAETDLLFIDTFHHRDCLKVELEKHGNQAQKFIITHDTETFGECGQADDSLIFVDFVATNEPGTGLWHAIRPWLTLNPQWQVKEHYKNNNGLTILERT